MSRLDSNLQRHGALAVASHDRRPRTAGRFLDTCFNLLSDTVELAAASKPATVGNSSMRNLCDRELETGVIHSTAEQCRDQSDGHRLANSQAYPFDVPVVECCL